MGFEIKNGVLVKYTEEKGVTEVTIPDSVTSIGDRAFFDCESLTRITIPDSIINIGDCAFCGCRSLINITIPDGVTSIGDGAFWGCKSLTSITIPDGVTSIGYAAFCWCQCLTNIIIPDSVTNINDDDFDECINLTDLTITVNGNELKINLSQKGNMKTIKALKNAVSLIRNKDFSVKLDLRIKYKLIMDYFFCTGDEDAKIYIKKNFVKAMKQCIENGDTDRINKILEKTDFVTKRNIDKFVTYATDNQQHEIQTILTDYKKQTFK